MEYGVYQLLGLFLIYSFLGWCCEVAFVAVTSGQVVNRGFLNGPVCPIYGVGMLGVLLILTPISRHVLLLFFGGMALCSAVELAGGWILERVFDTRWWDYSNEPFNLGGYICLGMSILWGLAVTFVVRLIHPFLLGLVDVIPHTLGIVLLAAFYALFATDLVMTLITIIGMKRRIRELERVAEALHAVGDVMSSRLGSTALAADARLDGLKESGQEKLTEGKEKVTAAVVTGQEKVTAVVATGQEKLTEGKEKVTAAFATGQEKMAENRQRLGSRVTETREELQQRRAQLEERMAEYRRRHGVRRLSRAFPNVRQAIQDRLDRTGEE